MTDDPFFARLRNDAAPLRHEPDAAALARIRARIRERIEERPGVAQILAAWLRPLAATFGAIALLAAIGFAAIDREEPAFGEESVEIVMAGDTYRVGD